jgi:hypothetical protein
MEFGIDRIDIVWALRKAYLRLIINLLLLMFHFEYFIYIYIHIRIPKKYNNLT